MMSSIVSLRCVLSCLFCLLVLGAPTAFAAPPEGNGATGDAAKVDQIIARWLSGPSADFDCADVNFQYEIPIQSFGLIEAAVQRPGLSPDAQQWLKQFIDRERPRVAARMRVADDVRVYNEWNIRTAGEAYQKFGHHDPRWDKDATAGIKILTTPNGDYRNGYQILSRAIAAGCDDPLARYFHARAAHFVKLDPATVEPLMISACQAMVESNYPHIRKELAALAAFEYLFEVDVPKFKAGAPEPAEFLEHLNYFTQAFLREFAPAVAEPGVPPRQIFQIASRIVNIELKPGMDRMNFYHPIAEPLAQALPGSPILDLIQGQFYVKYAWDARGGGWGYTVTPEAAKLMHGRLVEAEKALERAWERDPHNSKIADEMLTVALGEGWPSSKLDTWFLRAISANPDDREAYSSKLYFLEPKWYGSPEAMVAFGRECLASHNWYGQVPFMLITAHDRLASYAPSKAARDAYFQQPEVWADIQSVYIPFLKARPDAHEARTSYCRYACLAGQWGEADAQFKLLGDHAAWERFGSRQVMEAMRKTAAERAAR